MSKERYNVNKRITRFIFADYLFSCYYSQALQLYAISAFKIASYYFIFFFSYVSAKLRNTLPDFIRITEFTFSNENPGPHLVQWPFFLIGISLNIMHLVGICICYVF